MNSVKKKKTCQFIIDGMQIAMTESERKLYKQSSASDI